MRNFLFVTVVPGLAGAYLAQRALHVRYGTKRDRAERPGVQGLPMHVLTLALALALARTLARALARTLARARTPTPSPTPKPTPTPTLTRSAHPSVAAVRYR